MNRAAATSNINQICLRPDDHTEKENPTLTHLKKKTKEKTTYAPKNYKLIHHLQDFFFYIYLNLLRTQKVF